MSIIWAFQNSDTITKQNWDTHVIWILIWFYLFLVLALLMLLFPTPSSLCSYFPVNGIFWEGIPGFSQPNPKAVPWPPLRVLGSCCYPWVFHHLLWAVLLILLANRETSGRFFWPHSVQFQSHQPRVWFLHSEDAAKHLLLVVFGVQRPQSCLQPLQVQDRIPWAPPARWGAQEPGLCLLCCSPKPWEAEMLKLWPASSPFFWGFCGKPPALSHLNSSTEAPQTHLSSSVSWRVWSSKLFIKDTHLIISKRKLKDAQGQSVNRKRGLNSPNKLFADWIIHGRSRARLEGFDWGCQLPWNGRIPQNLAFSKAPFQYQMCGWSLLSLTPASTWC